MKSFVNGGIANWANVLVMVKVKLNLFMFAGIIVVTCKFFHKLSFANRTWNLTKLTISNLFLNSAVLFLIQFRLNSGNELFGSSINYYYRNISRDLFYQPFIRKPSASETKNFQIFQKKLERK